MQFFPKNWKTFALRLAGFYLILLVVIYFFQDNLLYHPSRFPVNQTQELAASVGLKLWPTDDANYRGLITAPPATSSFVRGTVIVVHGNAGSAVYRNYYAKALEPLGFEVLIYEYPGYGSREGKWGAASFVPDLRKVIQEVHQSRSGPIYLWGESMGCAVAAQAVSDPAIPVSGLVLLAPWDNLATVAQTHFPFLPARWLVRDKFDTVANLSQFRHPVVVIKLGRDEVIPPPCEQHVFDTLSAPKKLIVFPEATHNGWPADPQLSWWREAMAHVAPEAN